MPGLGASPMEAYAALAVLGLLPFAFMVLTSFAKISVVLAILRNALGTPQVPSGAIVTALSVLLSLFVMAPVGEAMAAAFAPAAAADASDGSGSRDDDAGGATAILGRLEASAEPLRGFLARHAGAREVALFRDLSRRGDAERAPADADAFLVLMPAFVITELSEAFQVGFLIFLPFLVVDLVVANILLALGMHMLSPTTVSVPFKLLLFVMVDGFALLARALVASYA